MRSMWRWSRLSAVVTGWTGVATPLEWGRGEAEMSRRHGSAWASMVLQVMGLQVIKDFSLKAYEERE